MENFENYVTVEGFFWYDCIGICSCSLVSSVDSNGSSTSSTCTFIAGTTSISIFIHLHTYLEIIDLKQQKTFNELFFSATRRGRCSGGVCPGPPFINKQTTAKRTFFNVWCNQMDCSGIFLLHISPQFVLLLASYSRHLT